MVDELNSRELADVQSFLDETSSLGASLMQRDMVSVMLMDATVKVEECVLMLKKMANCNSERLFNQSFGPSKLEAKMHLNQFTSVTNCRDQIKLLNQSIKSLQDYIAGTFAPHYFKIKASHLSFSLSTPLVLSARKQSEAKVALNDISSIDVMKEEHAKRHLKNARSIDAPC